MDCKRDEYHLLAPLVQDMLSVPASEAYMEHMVCGELTAGKRNLLQCYFTCGFSVTVTVIIIVSFQLQF